MKGGKTKTKMKNIGIALAAILMIALVATMGFATAKSVNSGQGSVNSNRGKAAQKALSIDDIEKQSGIEDLNGFDVKKASSELDRSVAREAREATFAQVSIGQGWATSGDEGDFARLFWVEKTFVNVSEKDSVEIELSTEEPNETVSFDDADYLVELVSFTDENATIKILDNTATIFEDESAVVSGLNVTVTDIEDDKVTFQLFLQEQTPATEITKAMGALKIGSDLYRLTLDTEASDSDTLVFDVVLNKGNVTGTLTLNSDLSLVGFTVWSGSLNLDNGKTWDINAATKNSRLKGYEAAKIKTRDREKKNETQDEKTPGSQGNLNAAERGQGQKIGLWARIRAFFRGE